MNVVFAGCLDSPASSTSDNGSLVISNLAEQAGWIEPGELSIKSLRGGAGMLPSAE